MDAVVIASSIQSDSARDKENGVVLMRIEKVLKGSEYVQVGQQVVAVYYGDVTVGRRFMLSGVDPPDLQWSCLPISPRVEKYVSKITEIADDPLARLRYYQDFLQDEESMLARDAYDEFAIAPYEAVQSLEPFMDHDQLVEWIGDPEMATDRKRLYLTMLGVCGDEKDLPILDKMLRSSDKNTRGGLDALVACYLTLSGEKGLPLIDELFLANKQAPYADTYAAIMAIRFHGTEGGVIERKDLVKSLHHVLEREDLADLVIPDLARWKDWSQIDRLVKLFEEADPENNWVRVPVVNYLRACPQPAAKIALEKLEKIDPESVRRANTFFTIPARDTSSDSSQVQPVKSDDENEDQVAMDSGSGLVGSMPAGPTAGLAPVPSLAVPTAPVASANPWRLAYVLALAFVTVMIAQFLLLSGGSQPVPERVVAK